jgi:prolyl oligopeptidase
VSAAGLAIAPALLLALAGAPAHAATYAGVDVPPPLPAKPVVDTHWGVTVEDPYRFLEDTADPAIQRWMRAQADATTAILARLPGREALLERLKAIDAAVPAVIGNVRRDRQGRLYYLKRNASENQFKLYRRDASGETLLVDAEAIGKAAGKPHAIGQFVPSPDGHHVAYSMSASGTEIGTLHVIDTSTRRDVVEAIDRIRWPGVAWLPDGSGFFYERLAADYALRPRPERFLDERMYFRALAKPAEERTIFGPGVHASVPLDRGDSTSMWPVTGRNLVFAVVHHGVKRQFTLYRAPLDAALAGKPAWTRVFDTSADVQDMASGDHWLYVRTARDAPRFKVLRMPIDAPDIAKATLVVPEGREVITDIAGTRDGLLVTRRDGAVKRLQRIAHGDTRMQPIALPVEGNVSIADAQVELSGAVVALGGWTRAARHYALDAKGNVEDLDLSPAGPYDAAPDIEAREVRVKSHDGVDVPVSILMRKGMALDGKNPLLLYGYGAYGVVEEPGLSPRLIAWLERGGIYAIAHVRGGGVFGDAWRLAGWKTTKPNTWKDGVAVAEWLVANRYTSRERMSIMGGSAGGIFVGRAITERPELFSAAVIAVGNVDSVRSETRANGAANTHEYGTVTKEDEFRALLAMSPYANVKPRTTYPAVLFEHGVNDSRVDVWMSTKLASRLAANTTSDAPVLLRLDYDAGHGVGSTRDQAQRQIADRWSFLLWRAGVAEFQPAAQ